MQTTVGTSEIELDVSDYADVGGGGQTLILQNLGAGDLYFDFRPGVAVGSGIKMASGGGYELADFDSRQAIYLISNSSVDLRYAVVG
jgi:hypothetical protein